MIAPAVSAQAIRAEVAELLGVSADRVAPGDDLIGQGLDSIRMMALSGRWRRRGLDIDFQTLAAEPTVAAWAELLAGQRADETAPEPVPDTGVAAPEDAHAPFPLAPMQHAMWVGREHDQRLGGVAGHLYVEFDGARVDPDRLRAAAAALARRHPMLRVEFLPDGTQRIGERSLPVTVVDLSDLGVADVELRLAETREAKSHQRLDGEVLQLELSLLPGAGCRLHVDLDMQAADAVSYRTLMSDLVRLYSGEQLAELGYTYRAYRGALAGRAPRAEDIAWWQQRLSELPEAPSLPLVPENERTDPHRTTRRSYRLAARQRDALFANARRRGITPAMAVAASFSGALRRWSATPRFLLNVPLFGREPLHPDVDELVGDFTSSLLLDVDLTDARTPFQRATAVQQTMREAAGHAGYPGLSVLRDLGRYRGHQVLAPVVFTSALGLGELFGADVTDTFGTPVWIISQGPQVLLDAQVTEVDGGVLVNWDVREDAFRPGVIDAMFDHHLTDLARLADADAAWDSIDAASVPPDQRAVRDEVNAVRADRTSDALHDGFFRSAAGTPDAPAVYSGQGDLTYAQLRAQVLAVTATLRERGVCPGDVVAVLGPKTAEQIPALLGIHAAGAAYLPIGVDQPGDRARRILETAGVRLGLVCGPESLTQPTALPVPSLTVADAIRTGLPYAAETEPAAIDPDELAYILFTSGSTGAPKGVEVTHAASMNTVEFVNSHFEIGPRDRVLALSTLEGDLSVLDIFGTLRAGAALVVVDEADRRNPDRWAALIRRHGVTVLHFMPGWLEMLAEVVSGQLDSVRVIPTGGDWVRPDLVRAFRRIAPGVRFAGLGGATETATHNTICEPGELPPTWTSIPFGRPLPNNVCRVVAADGADCPDWVPGEFWVSGGIARGYRGRPDLTAERFVGHDGRIWYRTGDLVRYLPDASIEFVGRADHRVKISGYRIELGEVEQALARVPGVDTAVVAVLPAPGGPGDQLAAIVRVADPALGTTQIATKLTEFVPPHMVPRHLSIVEQIPFTVGGKIDRAAVGALLTASMARGADDTTPRRAAATAVERAVADIFARLLARDTVGADDDFFALGGDSVLATAAVARIRDWLDASRTMVSDIFAARTVADLALRLAEQEGGGRLEAVAEMYLEVAAMENDEVARALDAPGVSNAPGVSV